MFKEFELEVVEDAEGTVRDVEAAVLAGDPWGEGGVACWLPELLWEWWVKAYR